MGSVRGTGRGEGRSGDGVSERDRKRGRAEW